MIDNSFKNLIALSNGKVLETSTGNVYASEEMAKYIKQQQELGIMPPDDLNVKQKADVVVGLDTQKIDLRLLTDTRQTPQKGFIVEVYESGSDGKLLKVYEEDVYDDAESNV
jgi:hypothetical protein